MSPRGAGVGHTGPGLGCGGLVCFFQDRHDLTVLFVIV